MTDQVYSVEQVLSVVGKISERDEWTEEERTLLGTLLASGVEQYRETLSADNQATFDAEVAALSSNGVEDDEVEGFILLGPSLLLANLVTKTVASTTVAETVRDDWYQSGKLDQRPMVRTSTPTNPR